MYFVLRFLCKTNLNTADIVETVLLTLNIVSEDVVLQYCHVHKIKDD